MELTQEPMNIENTELSDEQKKIAMNRYIKSCTYYRDYYYNRYNNDEEFRARRCEISKKSHEKHKDKKKEYYQVNKEKIRLKNRLAYHTKVGRREVFIFNNKEELDKYNLL